MATGTVKFFNRDRGFGFIVNDQAGPDIFVHARDLERSGLDTFLSEGDRVEFHRVRSPHAAAARDQLIDPVMLQWIACGAALLFLAATVAGVL